MREYTAFPISNARVGLDQSVEPWLLPQDGYQSMLNAHLYRGVLEKIEGYSLYARMSNRHVLSLVADGITTTFTGTLPFFPITTTAITVFGTLVLGTSAENMVYVSDTSSTVIRLESGLGGFATFNIVTGAYSITFNTAPPASTATQYSSIIITWDTAPAAITAIMGIKQYYASNGGQTIMIFDRKRVGTIINIFGTVAQTAGCVQGIAEIPHEYIQNTVITGDGATLVFSGTLASGGSVRSGVLFKQYTTGVATPANDIIDNGFGKLTGTNVDPANSTINYGTGAWKITFVLAPAANITYDSYTEVYGDLFTGSITDFFSLTNYQYKAFFCNNVNFIMYYDGFFLHFLNTNIDSTTPFAATTGKPTASSLRITKCLHVFTNRERLLLISPTIFSIAQVSTIAWATAGNPLDFSGNEFLIASTSESIRTFGFINSDLVVRFANSERVFRYTQDAFSPFRWDSTNSIWACDANFSAINYDSWFSSVGKPAIVASDGVNVTRADERIPDFTESTELSQQTPIPFMSQKSIEQCYGERFDDIKEGWLCYNSGKAQTTNQPSNYVLSFNYLDNTYAIYSFPFSCLGFGKIINVPTWGTTFTTWGAASDTWESYYAQSDALLDLGGDQFDKVYSLNDGNYLTLPSDGSQYPVLFDIFTKNFNPFVDQGELCRFGYVDFLVSAYATSTMRIQFYVNDQLWFDANKVPQGYYQETTLTFLPKDSMSPNTNQTKVWKRVYVGSIGKEHTMRLYQNYADGFAQTAEQPIFIHAMVLWMKPAGRMFN